MLSEKEKETLKEKVYKLLGEVGVKIENEEINSRLLKKGFKEGPSGRIRISKEAIEEMVSSQKKTQEKDAQDQLVYLACGVDWTHFLIWTKKIEEVRKRLGSQFMMSAFDCGPTKLYDYKEGEVKPVDTEIFKEMMKLGHSTPEIGYISNWYRQDLPPKIERIDSLILALKYTDKADGIESIFPEQIKYIKEVGNIVSDAAENTPYLAGSQCFTTPLILEKRSAEEMLERVRQGIKRYHIASMPTIGVSTPVTLAGSIVMEAAEILGGMAIAYALDPEGDLSGRAISTVVDMRNASTTPMGPEPIMANLGVKELFDAFWGGHVWVEVFFSPYAKKPGLQAVYENFSGLWNYSNLIGKTDISYPGMGTLDSGGTGSPAQLILDMEIRKSQFALKKKISVDEVALPFKEICEKTKEGKDFLTSEHTLKHFRQLWASQIFLNEEPKPGGWQADEKAILDKCDELWRENVKKYQPPQWPEDKIRALDNLLAKAKKELV